MKSKLYGRRLGMVGLQLLLMIGLFPALPQTTSQSTEAYSLRLSLKHIASGPRFLLEIHNAGNQALVLNLGTMLANGRDQYVDRIHLLLGMQQSKSLQLDLTEMGLVAGRIDPMVTPLPAGATLTLPIDLDDYSAPKDKIWALDLVPGQYTLRAEFTGAAPPRAYIPLMPYWTETSTSNIVPFTLTREFKSRRNE